MPDAARAVSCHPPSFSRRTGQPPVLTSPTPISTLLQRFACARLSRPCRPGPCVQVCLQRSPPRLLTAAACSGLRSAHDCRPRRALLHLSYSCPPPFGRAMLVTQDPDPDVVAPLTQGAEHHSGF